MKPRWPHQWHTVTRLDNLPFTYCVRCGTAKTTQNAEQLCPETTK